MNNFNPRRRRLVLSLVILVLLASSTLIIAQNFRLFQKFINQAASPRRLSVNLNVAGFTPGETVLIEVILNDSRVATTSSVVADSKGRVVRDIPVDKSWPAGKFTVTATGTPSGTVRQRTYETNPAPAAAQPSTPSFPFTGKTVATFDFSGSGFNPNESVSTWITLSANNQSYGLPSVKADSGGKVVFKFEAKADMPNGTIRIVAHGQSSNHEVYQDQTFSYTPPEPPRNPSVGANLSENACRKAGGHYAGTNYQGVRGGSLETTGRCVDVKCQSGCCFSHCQCTASCPPPPPLPVPTHTPDELLASGTTECNLAKSGQASMGACAGSVAWGDCIKAGGSSDVCRSTAQANYNQYKPTDPALVAFDAALDNVKAAAGGKTLTDAQLTAAASEVASGKKSINQAISDAIAPAQSVTPPPKTGPTVPTPTNNPPQTFQTSCISTNYGGSPASCDGDKAWASCKLGGGSDADCRVKAQQAYIQTEDLLKQQGKWSASYDQYDATLDNLRGILASPPTDPVSVKALADAGITKGQVVSDQVLLLATQYMLNGRPTKIADGTTTTSVFSNLAAALGQAQLDLNPKLPPPTVPTTTATAPDLTNLSPTDVKGACDKSGVTGGYQVFDRKNLTCYNCSPPYDKDIGCVAKATYLCQPVALDPQSRSACISREITNIGNETIPLSQIIPEQPTVQTTCNGDSLTIGSGANSKQFNCGSVGSGQSPKCSMGECVSAVEAARRNSSAVAADNYCPHIDF